MFIVQYSIILLSQIEIRNQTFLEQSTDDFLFLNSGIVKISDSLFTEIRFFKGGTFIFEIDIGEVYVTNSTFKNNGWCYIVFPSHLSNIEYNSLFYLWSDLIISIQNSTFSNQGKYSLFSGFIETCIQTDLLIINSSFFEASDHFDGFHYHGLLLRDAGKVLISNNQFHGLRCSNHNSFIHNNGILSLQGSSSYIKKINFKSTILTGNIFQECQCQNGGSLAIINFNTISIQRITYF